MPQIVIVGFCPASLLISPSLSDISSHHSQPSAVTTTYAYLGLHRFLVNVNFRYVTVVTSSRNDVITSAWRDYSAR